MSTKKPAEPSGSKKNCRLIYCTAATFAEAEQIGRQLVTERRVACVNLLPQMTSIYHWQGKTETSSETVLLLKTTVDQLDELINRIRELHSYELPAIITLPIESGLPEYLEWIAQQVHSS